MKKIKLMKGMFATLLLASTAASAQTEYPASDFQPKVLYKDSEYIDKHQQAASSGSVKADPKYPAANFQPKVLYKDPNYKPSKTVSVSAATVDVAQSTAPEAVAEEKEDSSLTFLIGLVVAGAVGFFLLKKQPETKQQGSQKRPVARKAAASANSGSQLTGVARYLSEKQVPNTGVSRYLEKQKQTPVSSVAKYLAKQVLKEREALASKVTGVEKYLRNRG